MKADPLHRLIADADAALPPPARQPDLAQCVQRKARHQVRVRNASALAIAGVLVLAGGWFVGRGGKYSLAPAPLAIEHGPSVEAIHAQLASLEQEIRVHRQTANQLEAMRLASRRRWNQVRQLANPDPIERVLEAENLTATIMLQEARRAATEAPDRPDAGTIHRRAVQLFPDTPAIRAEVEPRSST